MRLVLQTDKHVTHTVEVDRESMPRIIRHEGVLYAFSHYDLGTGAPMFKSAEVLDTSTLV